jgi:hypothetical protein
MNRAAPHEKMENPRQRTEGSKNEGFRSYSLVAHGRQARPHCRDQRIEGYLGFINLLNRNSSRGPVATHCVTVATKAYREFCASCDPFYRRSSWRAISMACQLFAQRSRQN